MPFDFNSEDDINRFIDHTLRNVSGYIKEANTPTTFKESITRWRKFGATGKARAATFEVLLGNHSDVALVDTEWGLLSKLFFAYALTQNSKYSPTLTNYVINNLAKTTDVNFERNAAFPVPNISVEQIGAEGSAPSQDNAKRNDNLDNAATTSEPSLDRQVNISTSAPHILIAAPTSITETEIRDLYSALTATQIKETDPEKQALLEKRFKSLLRNLQDLINSGKALQPDTIPELKKLIQEVNSYMTTLTNHTTLISHYNIFKSLGADGDYDAEFKEIPENLRRAFLMVFYRLSKKSLHYSIIENGASLKQIQSFFEAAPIDTNIKDNKFPRPPLFAALARGEIDIINFVSKTNPELVDPEEDTSLLHEAAKSDVKILFQSDINTGTLLNLLYCIDHEQKTNLHAKQTPLHVAISAGNLNTFYDLLFYLDQTHPGLKADVFLHNEFGDNIIHFLLKTYDKVCKDPANCVETKPTELKDVYLKMLRALVQRMDDQALMQKNAKGLTPSGLVKKLQLSKEFKNYLIEAKFIKFYQIAAENCLQKPTEPAPSSSSSSSSSSYNDSQSDSDSESSNSNYIQPLSSKKIEAAKLNVALDQVNLSGIDIHCDKILRHAHTMLADYEPSTDEILFTELVAAISDPATDFSYNIFHTYEDDLIDQLRQHKVGQDNLAHHIMKQLINSQNKIQEGVYPRILFLAWLVPDLFSQQNAEGLTPIQIASQFNCNFEKLSSFILIAKETIQPIADINSPLHANAQKPSARITIALAEQKKQYQTYQKLMIAIENVLANDNINWQTSLGGAPITITKPDGTKTSKTVSSHAAKMSKRIDEAKQLNTLSIYQQAWKKIIKYSKEGTDPQQDLDQSSLTDKVGNVFGSPHINTQRFYNTLLRFAKAPETGEIKVEERMETELTQALKS